MDGRGLTADEVCQRIRPMLVPGFRAKITINIDRDELLPEHVSVEIRPSQRSLKDKM